MIREDYDYFPYFQDYPGLVSTIFFNPSQFLKNFEKYRKKHKFGATGLSWINTFNHGLIF